MTAKKIAAVQVVPVREPWSPLKWISIMGAVGLALAFFPAWWTFTNHWMNRDEIEATAKKVADKADAQSQKEDAALKSHQDHDNGVQMWNQFGFADTRRQFLEDHKFECDTKKMMMPKLAPVDAAVCTHYESAYAQKVQEANDLKGKAMESTREK